MKNFYLFAVISLLFSQKTFSQAAFSVQGNLCINTSLSFIDESIGKITSWSWDFSDGITSNIQNPTHTFTDTGSFTVKLSIITSTGTGANVSHVIHISAPPIVNFTVDSTQVIFSSYARIFTSTTLSSNPVSKYFWNFGEGSDKFYTESSSYYYKFSDKGTYEIWLTAVDMEGCTDSASQIIEVHNRYYVPNVFTPNDDNINDNFIVTSNGVTPFSIEIYSRWGNLVFKRKGHEQIIWDGRMPDGSLVKPGTYYYVINSENGNITYEPEKGFITVFY